MQVSGAATRGQKDATVSVLIMNMKVPALPEIQTMALLALISHPRCLATELQLCLENVSLRSND